jgi:RES domain-containing protein
VRVSSKWNPPQYKTLFSSRSYALQLKRTRQHDAAEFLALHVKRATKVTNWPVLVVGQRQAVASGSACSLTVGFF